MARRKKESDSSQNQDVKKKERGCIGGGCLSTTAWVVLFVIIGLVWVLVSLVDNTADTTEEPLTSTVTEQTATVTIAERVAIVETEVTPTLTASLHPTNTPIDAPTSTPLASDELLIKNSVAPVRDEPSGLGSELRDAGQGDVLKVVGVLPDGEWYLLADGGWVHERHVSNAPTDLAVVTPTPTPTRIPTSTPTATNTPSLEITSSPQSATGELDVNPDDDLAQVSAIFWNIELNDASPDVIARQIADYQDVDIWGIAEVNQPQAVTLLERAAEDGEESDFTSVLSVSGGGDRLLAIYDSGRFELLDQYEIDAINTTGNARAPLVLHLRERELGTEFLFMVNHLYRSRDEERYRQAELLNDWVQTQTMPIIAVGDYNFDWAVNGTGRDRGYDLMTEGAHWYWVQPDELVTTQCSGWPCSYESVLDFIFVAGPAREWQIESEIIVLDGDFPDDATTSDHRPVLAKFWPEEIVSEGTPAVTGATSNSGANLRAGPGTAYDVVGGVEINQSLDVVGRNQDGSWLQLGNGMWIAAYLVDNAPTDLSIADAPQASRSQSIVVDPQSSTSGQTPTEAPPLLQAIGDLRIITVDKREEWAAIRNDGVQPVNLRGWTLLSERGSQSWTVGFDFELAPGAVVNIHALGGVNDANNLYSGFGSNIWNNSESDPAILIAPDGTPVSRYP